MSNHTHHIQFPLTSLDSTAAFADDSSQADYDNALSSTSEAPLQPPHAAGSKKRKPPKTKGSKTLSRPASTPQLRDDAMSDSDDKKRNKLGYQRISIACAHCRRRKIRCVLSDGDPHQRCQNCIRLKKECVFYPVDQQAAMEHRVEPSSKTVPGSGPPSIVSSSPSNPGLDRAFDSGRDFPPFSSLPSNAPSNYQGLPLEPGSALHTQGMVPSREVVMSSHNHAGMYAQSDYSYRHDSEHRPWPPSATLSSTGSSSISDGVDAMSHGYTRYSTAPGVRGDFAPFPAQEQMHLSHHPHNATQFDLSNHQREGMLWQQPQPLRSMSYGHIEHLGSDQATYNAPFQSGDHGSQNAMMHYATPLDVRNVSTMPQEAGPHSAPVRPPIPGPGHPHASPMQQGHGGLENGALRPQLYAAPWYHEQQNYNLAEEPETYANTQQSQPG